jgi:protein-S-isoprenylcysteine O-methyltransferase Ste14
MRDLRDTLFTYRSYTPIPFLVLGLIFGRPTLGSMAAGLLVAILGESLRFWGVGHASYETRVTGSVGAPRLVVSGPFAYLRNPLYVGNMLLYTGFGVMSNLPILIAATAVWFLFQYWMIVSREEEFLAKEFPDEYARYRAAVPKFLPRLTPYGEDRESRIQWDVAVKSERRTFQAFAIALLLMSARFVFLEQ